MKICFALPDAHVGGIRTFALNFGRQFGRDGHEVTALIIARGQTARNPGDAPSSAISADDGPGEFPADIA